MANIFFDLLRLHALSALASLCARVNGFAFGFTLVVGVGVTLPAPENVSLDGAPKRVGWGMGAALHESASLHAGGTLAPDAGHGEISEQMCAS